MRLSDIIIFSLCVGFFIIAIYETMTRGIEQAYWIFMLSVGLLFLYQLRKMKLPKEPSEPPPSQESKLKRKVKK